MVFIKGLDKIDCQCLSSTDLGDGRFEIKVNYDKLKVSPSLGIYLLEVILTDDQSDGQSTQPFLLIIRKGINSEPLNQ